MDTPLEKTVAKVWHKSKWVIKGLIIGFLALLLMIPMMYVKDLVKERQERQQTANQEISSKWAGPQNIIGPVIGLPYRITTRDTSGKEANYDHIAYFLPENLDITTTIDPREKHRGIFKVMLYSAKVSMTGSFDEIPLQKLGILPEQVAWDKAFISMSIADTRGLNDQLTVNWNDSTVELLPKADAEAMTGLLKINSIADLNNARFSVSIDINGSEKLLFTPVGKSTTLKINSTWKHPSFSGNLLPQQTEIADSGFTANWKSMAHKRHFPQQWIDKEYYFGHYFPVNTGQENSGPPPSDETRAVTIKNDTVSSVGTASFGVDLFIPVNGYQKTLRSIKYSMLCILLTFTAFFLIETANKKSAHPFQYGLIGLALVLFYTLLLSVSEYTGFNSAYMIASLATIGLIAWFVRGILQSGRATTVLSVVLVLIHSYVFTLLQLQDYSLLLGSVGLFLTLAVIMYFSKKLQW